VFSFVLAVCEINAFLFLRNFVYTDGTKNGAPTLLEFRHLLAWELIKNRWIMEEDLAANAPITKEHQLVMVPQHAHSFSKSSMAT
jgi:hypothetical protein